MNGGGPSGFNNAPVARALVIACGLFTVIFGIQGRSNKLGLSYQDIFKNLQLWKLVVSNFAFSSTPELLFGLYLLYYFRVFERQIGSNKYSVVVVVEVVEWWCSVGSGGGGGVVRGSDGGVVMIVVVEWRRWSSGDDGGGGGRGGGIVMMSGVGGGGGGGGVVVVVLVVVVELVVVVVEEVVEWWWRWWWWCSGGGSVEVVVAVVVVVEVLVEVVMVVVFVMFSIIVSLLFEVLGLGFLKDSTLNVLTSGPYGVIFSSFVPFYLDIPVSTRFRVFGLRFTDKSFIYLAGLQLLLSSWKRSILPGICGILAGALYRLNVLHIRRLKFPDFVASFFSRLSWPSMGSTVTAAPSRNVPRNIPSYAVRQVEAIEEKEVIVVNLKQWGIPSACSRQASYPAAPLASTAEPAEDSIATLVSMGFDRSSARQALIHARNDLNAATNILLEAQSH
ncbi:hypothetical protein RHMOL_Rhmol07G0231700 [Rhododendron molle]|uniref:Uncharacterized protein n=1 Tax=Rhododendron molle TaxID=49168 RepID=A0ACC0N410_RHOML|nr:hypothetical protein RHMOL_Rhmol07G0231700 [Rhododendron molle]